MALTREERGTIEDMLNRIRKLEAEVSDQQIQIDGLLAGFNALDSESNILDWTQKQLEDFLRPIIQKFQDKVGGGRGIPRHTHENDSEGGPCFAQRGATLIE